jgi:carboxymethylenebutenolidase
MADHAPRFTPQQIGTSTVRFPSGVPIPSITDASTDPYFKTRISKEVLVEGVQFKPQVEGSYPGLIVLHDAWGLTAHIQSTAAKLACEGYAVLVPNLYGRQGGMVTANEEVAQALASRAKEADLLQDINSCCEYLNTQDRVKRNTYGVIGFGMGGSLAIRFACQRKRLRGAVSFYGKITTPPAVLKNLVCPLLYHHADRDPIVGREDLDVLVQAGKDSGKPVEIQVYDAPYEFSNDLRQDRYRPEAAQAAWHSTLAFLTTCFQADR